MRAHMLGVISAISIVVTYQTANATPSGIIPPSALTSMLAASHKCPDGQRWVSAGYAKHGKWRPGHCARA